MCLFALVLVAGLAGCAPAFPPVATGVPGDHGFKARIARDYPPGSPARRLRDDLSAEGFVIAMDPVTGYGTALSRPANLPCFGETRIDWREDRRGRVVRVQAQRLDCS